MLGPSLTLLISHSFEVHMYFFLSFCNQYSFEIKTPVSSIFFHSLGGREVTHYSYSITELKKKKKTPVVHSFQKFDSVKYRGTRSKEIYEQESDTSCTDDTQ